MSDSEGGRLLAGDTWVFAGITNSGYRSGCLVDTGVDEQVYRDLEISDVVVTHGHADHFSCAAALKASRGVRVVAPREEAALIENPEVNIRGMFSWAKPSDEMVTRLFRGEGCEVDVYLDQWSCDGMQQIPLPGHTLGHTGVLTDDGVLFTGDSLYAEELWERHPLPYAIDIGLVLNSLDIIASVPCEWVVPGHGSVIESSRVGAEVRHHRSRIEAICDIVIEATREPRTTEQVIADVSRALQLRQNPAQYWLSVTTAKGFLSYLMQTGAVEFFVADHAGNWRAV